MYNIYMYIYIYIYVYVYIFMCRGQLVSALLYADDAVIFAEDEELMRRGLDILAEWCEE